MSKEVLAHIESRLVKFGFTRVFVTKGQRVYALGDNHFEKTKRFARFSIIYSKGMYTIAAMTATAIKGGGDHISRIDWVETARVSKDKFDTAALKLTSHLIRQCQTKIEDKGSELQ